MTKTQNPLDLMAALNPAARAAIERETAHLAVPAGHTLFHQGERGDSLYLVLAGTLGVYVPEPTGGERLLAVIQSGESVGEMAVISGEARATSVRAIRDSELLILTKARFDLLLKREPELMAGLNRLLVHRLRQATRGAGRHIEPKTVAFLPVGAGVDTADVAGRLASQLKEDGFEVVVLRGDEAQRSSRWFTKLEQHHDHIFLCGAPGDQEWIRLCARQADRILVVANADGQATPELPGDLLQQRAAHQLLDLLLLHDGAGGRPARTGVWSLAPFNRHFHIRQGNPKDWQRMARAIVGRGVGFVLSGGGARAFAEIGVLKAIEEANLPVDFVGGSSMGAVLAAGIAMGWSTEELSARVHEAFVRSNPLNDYTLPIVGLVKGKKVERRLRRNFGDARIEDLWLPFFCVSSDLTAGTLHVHRSGDLVDALRASISLPGILPPCAWGDSLLVDGGVMNNLPVDIMRGVNRGPIIAVDVTRDRAITPDILDVPSGLAWFKRLLNPPLIALLMRAGTVSGEARHLEHARDADLLIEPPLGDIDIRDWRAFDRAVAIGHAHARKVLAAAAPRLRRPRMAPAA